MKKILSLVLSIIIVFSSLAGATTFAKETFVSLNTKKVMTGVFNEDVKVNYYKLTLKKKSKVSFLAYNGSLEEYYKINYKVYKDKNLKNLACKGSLRVTDTDVWGVYKKLNAGTYYITFKSKESFKYYVTNDIIPVKNTLKFKNINKVEDNKFTKTNKTHYYKMTLKNKSKVAFLAHNGSLEEYYKINYRIYKDKKLKKFVCKGKIKVTDTDMWSLYKKLNAGTYYITFKSADNFKYYLDTDVLPVKK